MNFSRIRGFTLIELLVVMAIIALLSSVVFASLANARAKARDTRRIADVRSVVTALELYKDAHGTYPSNTAYGEYEAGALPPNGCRGWDTSTVQKLATASSSWLGPLVSEGYMPRMPLDPLQGMPVAAGIGAWQVCVGPPYGYGYVYNYYTAGSQTCATSSGNFYVIKVLNMETVPSGQNHPLSPGWSCPADNSWNTAGAFVTGSFE